MNKKDGIRARKTRWYTPLHINRLGIVFGAISIIAGLLCSNVAFFSVPPFLIDVLFAVGASFIAGAILNIISEYKIGNLLTQTVMNGIYETSASARNIRYNQTIEFTINEPFEFEGKNYLKLDCIHSYRLHNESTFDKRININIFNDHNISEELNEKLPPEYKTQFEEITIKHSHSKSDSEKYHPNNPEHKNKFLEQDKYGRPCFIAKNIKIDARNGNDVGWMEICYKIINAHYLKSTHSWYFQELSNGLDLFVVNKAGCSNSCFSLIINHPNREEMESYNVDSINTSGQLRESTLKDGNQYSSIKINSVFLPYQGFYLKWDLTKYVENLKKESEEL